MNLEVLSMGLELLLRDTGFQGCKQSKRNTCPQAFFFFFKDYSCVLYMGGLPSSHQKRQLDLTIDGCEPPCDCWESYSEPLEGQSSAFNH
jgi:hypothetical protein